MHTNKFNRLRTSKFTESVWAWIPNRLSDAIATQFFPFIATTAPPLYSKIDWKIDFIIFINVIYALYQIKFIT